jgi:hypothetical protein
VDESLAQAGAGQRTFVLAAVAVAVIALYGIAGRLYTILIGWAQIRSDFLGNIFYRLYALHERSFLVTSLVFACIAVWAASRSLAPAAGSIDRLGMAVRRLPPWSIALVTLVVTGLGSLFVMHSIGLSMDEFAADFQARIFSTGQLTATIPERWRAMAPWMTPTFITYKEDTFSWVASYLPVYSLMRVPFVLLHAEWLLNPLLAAVTVLLLDRVARRLWPGDDRRRLLAIAFLVTSSQFLVTSMTRYSMPAHLCLNLLWLLLYLRDDRTGYLLVPWVGVIAMGLHNPFPHALFVAPFLLRLVVRRRWSWLGYMAAVYLAGATMWLQWLQFTGAGSTTGTSAGGLLASFELPSRMILFTNGLNLSLVLTWQTPVLALAFIFALFVSRRLPDAEQDLAAGVLLTFAFYLLFPSTQGHGWGYRYIYGALGNLALVGATGTMLAVRATPGRTMRTLVAASLLLSVAYQIPLRFQQSEAFVRPYARAMHFLATRPAPLIGIDFRQGWYSWDLVRNDPLFREGPAIVYMGAGRLPPLQAVPPTLRDSVYVVTRAELARFGIPLFPLRGRRAP